MSENKTPLLLALPLCLSLAACASGGAKKSMTDREFEVESGDYVERQVEGEPKNAGKILAEFDGKMRAWSGLTAVGDDTKDGPRATGLFQDLKFRANRHLQLLIDELQFGVTKNRIIAAMAVGFSGSDEALSPLLAALEDADERVEINALIGLYILRSKDTPLGVLTDRMTSHPNPTVRHMAADALAYCVQEGATGDGLVVAAHKGLIDEEPMVRARSALLLAELVDAESIDLISDLLYDEVQIVKQAARQSITYIGLNDDQAKGDAARALGSALSKAESKRDEKKLILYMQTLSTINLGDDVDEWLRWANDQP